MQRVVRIASVAGRLAGVPVRFVALEDLLAAKRQAGRHKNLADIEGLAAPRRRRTALVSAAKSRRHEDAR